MSNKMLIDASHPEETRVVVTRGNRIEEFDFESQSKKQLKGNIYLARVTRVEPSLQAAFVEYGGNRHGFLAFSEIHPDYYQIPVADRQALLAAEAAEAEADDEDEEREKADHAKRKRRRGGRGRGRATTKANDDAPQSSDSESEANEGGNAEAGTDGESVAGSSDDDSGSQTMAASVHADVISEELPEPVDDELRETETNGDEVDPISEVKEDKKTATGRSRRSRGGKRTKVDGPAEDEGDNGDLAGNGDVSEDVESVGAEDALEELPSRRREVRRQYKIQEVIKRRQILLVQVVKEERGNKGAALTTYLSLAGRYSVLMPNTARGGGISRKITNMQDRKRLKEVVRELEVPQGMGVILRTAGANRTKAEIKRDYEYLMRLWMTIRNLTLESTAPALVHEEGSLIKRSVRDLYNKDIGEILVAGDDGYREAKDFMRMLMPSHAKAVQPYKEAVPIFARSGIEAQLDRMLQPQVTLRSGGYIIINQTEALVAIDVNSGRSTREHSIEDTALQTNLEAAEEVARQLRLRDLAGLIVIDFIDMEEKRNNRSVEKRLKDCLKHDRARIQVGRISHFGLLEMSRQRIRASVLESTMQPCEVCHGTGYVRSESSVALHVVRGIEEYLLKDSSHDIVVKTPTATALYVLNNKRANLSELEERFGLSIDVEADETLGAQHFQISKGAPAAHPARPATEIPTAEAEEVEEEPIEDTQPADRSEEGGRKRRRRRRRKSGKGADGEVRSDDNADIQKSDTNEGGDDSGDGEPGSDESDSPKKRRRGRRGGKRNRSDAETKVSAVEDDGTTVAEVKDEQPAATASVDGNEAETGEEEAPPKRGGRRKEKAEAAAMVQTETVVAAADAEDDAEPVEKPKRKSPAKQLRDAAPKEPVVTSVISETGGEGAADGSSRKVGWWRKKGFL